jgi:hypothetical protein
MSTLKGLLLIEGFNSRVEALKLREAPNITHCKEK